MSFLVCAAPFAKESFQRCYSTDSSALRDQFLCSDFSMMAEPVWPGDCYQNYQIFLKRIPIFDMFVEWAAKVLEVPIEIIWSWACQTISKYVRSVSKLHWVSLWPGPGLGVKKHYSSSRRQASRPAMFKHVIKHVIKHQFDYQIRFNLFRFYFKNTLTPLALLSLVLLPLLHVSLIELNSMLCFLLCIFLCVFMGILILYVSGHTKRINASHQKISKIVNTY
jgi:hypothetical protein